MIVNKIGGKIGISQIILDKIFHIFSTQKKKAKAQQLDYINPIQPFPNLH